MDNANKIQTSDCKKEHETATRFGQAIHLLDRGEDIIILVISLLLFLIGLYALIDSYLVYQHANDTSLLKFKPGYEGEEPDRSIRGDMVAWLTVEDTKIDDPVMQGKNNEEYLNKDPYGDYSMSGSIFLDSRNNKAFTDGYSLIYGHHMEGDAMFGALHHFLEKGFMKKHPTGILTVGETVYEIRFFAAMEASATQEYIFAPTEYEKQAVFDYVKKHADIYRKKVADKIGKEDRLIALSTCKYPDSVDRVVVFGVLRESKDHTEK